MKYAIKISGETGHTQNETDDFEEARQTAISLSRWNIECSIVDENGEELKHFSPWNAR